MANKAILDLLLQEKRFAYGVTLRHDLASGYLPDATVSPVDVVSLLEELIWHRNRCLSVNTKQTANIISLQHRGVNRLSEYLIEKQEIGLNLHRRPVIEFDIESDKRYATIDKDALVPSGVDLKAYFDDLCLQVKDDNDWVAQLWLSALEHTFNQFDPNQFKACDLLTKGRLRGLCKEWFSYASFKEDIKEATNYNYAAKSFSHGIYAANTPFIPTGTYHCTGVAMPGCFDFLHENEIHSYLTQETRGVYSIQRTDLLTSLCVPLDMDGDRFATELQKHGAYVTDVLSTADFDSYRIRYAKSLGEVDFGCDYDYHLPRRSADSILCNKHFKTLPYHEFVLFDIVEAAQAESERFGGELTGKLNMVFVIPDMEFYFNHDELFYLHCLYLIDVAKQHGYIPGEVTFMIARAFVMPKAKEWYLEKLEKSPTNRVYYTLSDATSDAPLKVSDIVFTQKELL